MFAQGKYHCKYIKYTACGITVGDAITRIDSVYDFIPIDLYFAIMVSSLLMSFVIPFALALRHYYKVQRLNHKHNDIHSGRAE